MKRGKWGRRGDGLKGKEGGIITKKGARKGPESALQKL